MKFFLQKSCGPKKPDATQSEIKKIAPFISKQTNKALRISIKTITKLVDLLLSSKYDFKYVLTGKFNQDYLEASYLQKLLLIINYFCVYFFLFSVFLG